MSQQKSIEHIHSIGVYDDWETPPELFFDACARYNIFPELDVCATSQNTKCPKWFEKDNPVDDKHPDGKSVSWTEDFFMNPPYSEIEWWIGKAFYEHRKNNVNALVLTFHKGSTKWWHRYVEGIAEVHNIDHRVKFLKGGVEPITVNKKTGKLQRNPAPYDSCWIIWRKK